jgi:hypothetical protein
MELIKMTRPTKRVHNLETNTVQDIELNDEEYAVYLEDIEANETRLAEAEAKATAKAALLAQLGITEEQAKLLLS